MITPQIRTQIAAQIGSRLAGVDCQVLAFGVTGPFQPPCAVLGQPDVDYDVQPCVAKVTIGLAVVVRHHPQGPEATQRDLETLWPQVAAAVRDLEHTDPTLGGQINDFHLTRAEFGSFDAQGNSFPAQNLVLEIHL